MVEVTLWELRMGRIVMESANSASSQRRILCNYEAEYAYLVGEVVAEV